MKLNEAQALADLRAAGQQLRTRAKSKTAEQVTAEIFAQAAGRGEPFVRTEESWRKHWLPSQKFHLVRMPLNAAALPCEPKVGNLVLKKVHAMEDTPITIDYNKNRVGQSLNGFIPEVIVIDGKHRWKAAQIRGESHIMAYVGEEAMEALPSLQACACCAEKKMEAVGSGGGPDPMFTVPAKNAKLVAEGGKVSKMVAKTPPGDGCENMVKGLKKSNVDNPYAVAWDHYNKYGTCAKTKGK